MPRKRKAPEQKPQIIPEEVEEETSDDEEESEPEEEEEESEPEEEEDDEDDEEEDSSSSEDETNDEKLKRENLRQLLEPFGKDQIIDLLKEAVVKDPKLLAKITEVADSDPVHRKIFVHGLGWDATSEQLLDAFRPFGEIEESKLITDKNTGRAKGYAFVQFKTRAAAKKALKISQKRIGSRMVSCQLAAAGPPAGVGSAADGGSRKIYVGNVGPHVSAVKLKEFFSRYGELEDGPVGLDFVTNKFKGFAIITYKSPEGYKKAMEEPIKVFENCQLHCKKFVEKENKNNSASQVSTGSVNPTSVGYGGLGVNPGVLGTNMNPNASGLFMPQTLGIGFPGNPMLAAGYNPAGLMASGLSTPVGGLGGGYGINSINSGVMGSYGSQATLQGLGPYQSSQVGHSSLGTAATATTSTRAPAGGASPAAAFPGYYGR